MKRKIDNIISIINNNNYTVDDNIISFINNDYERPNWSKLLDKYYSNKSLKIGYMYTFNKKKQLDNEVMQEHFRYISKTNGIIIDLASGPSGYFGTLLNMIKEDSTFIITDASKAMIHSHSVANKKRNNVLIFDLDLNIPLPFKDNCIDIYCGNIVSNVDDYKSLLKEVYRTLKVGGKAAFIELFFEEETKTHKYLKENNRLTSSLDYFLEYCKSLGFKVLNTQLEHIEIGKQKEDLLPIDENDKKIYQIIYLIK